MLYEQYECQRIGVHRIMKMTCVGCTHTVFCMCSVNSKIEVPVTPEDMCQAFGHDSSMCGLPLLQSQSPGGIRAGRICTIADDRTFGIGQMHPDLIAPTRLGCQFD